MIIYKDIIKKLGDAGYNTVTIRKDKLIPEGTIQNIRDGRMVNLKTIDTICRLTGLGVGEIMEYKKDEKTQNNV